MKMAIFYQVPSNMNWFNEIHMHKCESNCAKTLFLTIYHEIQTLNDLQKEVF